MSAALVLLLLLQAQTGRNPGNPLDHLPANIEVLTHFGERADISFTGSRRIECGSQAPLIILADASANGARAPSSRVGGSP